MKTKVLSIILLGASLGLGSCSDYLDMTPTDRASDKLVWSKLDYAEQAEDVSEEDGVFEVITDYTEFQTVLENLKAAGYAYEEAEISMNPENKVEITDLETAKKVMVLYDALDDLDDVQDVYANFDIAEELLDQLD